MNQIIYEENNNKTKKQNQYKTITTNNSIPIFEVI